MKDNKPPTKTIAMIVAYAKNRVIGQNNTLPWHLPEDLKRFRALTTGHHIIMGRKTYESLGKLLPGRTTVIVTRNPDYKVAGALIASSVAAAISLCQGDDEPFIIGGAELYADGLNHANKLYVTQIYLTVEGDAFFPVIDKDLWKITSHTEHIAENGLKFSYQTHERLV